MTVHYTIEGFLFEPQTNTMIKFLTIDSVWNVFATYLITYRFENVLIQAKLILQVIKFIKYQYQLCQLLNGTRFFGKWIISRIEILLDLGVP